MSTSAEHSASDATETTGASAPYDDGPEPDYYAVLGVKPGVESGAIRHAYRRLAKLWHPDRYTHAPPDLRERAERRMRALVRAYAVLGDPVSRRAYDRRRAERESLRAAAYADLGEQRVTPAVGNPHGASQLAGVLCLILALGIGGGALANGTGTGWQALVLFVLVLGFAMLALIFFSSDSQPARLADGLLEKEPEIAYEPYSFTPAPTPDEGDVKGEEIFGRLVEEALSDIPLAFAPFMRNVVVQVEDEPSDEQLRSSEVEEGATLLGLYVGVPLTHQSADGGGPEVVTIFRGPIERYCDGDPDAIRDQVRRTVLHEVAHHFGMDHDAMPDWLL